MTPNHQAVIITGAVAVIGGLVWWINRDDDDETVVSQTQNRLFVNQGSCPDDFSCPAKKSHCDDGTCVTATSKFKKWDGSLYPAYGVSDLKKPHERYTIRGSEACAKACLDDPDCIAFTHWKERYSIKHPKDGNDPHPDVDLCYYWSGPQGDNKGISPGGAIGPSSEGKTDAPAQASVAKTYILKGKENYVPSSPSAAETGTPYSHPSANFEGSSLVIVDPFTKV